VPVHYVRLSDKHLDETMQPAALVGLSHRRAVIEAADPLPGYTNIMLRFEEKTGGEETPELYAKVIRPLDEAEKRYLIHFTSVSPGLRERLRQIERRGGKPRLD